MAKQVGKKVIWSKSAHEKKQEILGFWTRRIGSSTYSKKLNRQIKDTVKIISIHNFIGKKSNLANIRTFHVSHYLLIYKITPTFIIIIKINDTRDDPEKVSDYR